MAAFEQWLKSCDVGDQLDDIASAELETLIARLAGV
jgi:hypothetical protein